MGRRATGTLIYYNEQMCVVWVTVPPENSRRRLSTMGFYSKFRAIGYTMRANLAYESSL